MAEAARNLACVGARPLGLADCLNFGSPENPAVMWQFSQVIEGMRDACIALKVPVVSGNVSFYNELMEFQSIRPLRWGWWALSRRSLGFLRRGLKLLAMWLFYSGVREKNWVAVST